MLVARDSVGEISITPPTPAALPVALPAVANRSPSSVSIYKLFFHHRFSTGCDTLPD